MIRREIILYDKEIGEKEIKIPIDTAIIKLEIPSGINLTIQGKLTKDSKNYFGLMGVKSSDLKSYINMTDGLFSIEVNGIYSVKFNIDVESTIVIRMIG